MDSSSNTTAPSEAKDDWEANLVRYRADDCAVEACNSGSSSAAYYDLALLSLISQPMGSLAFINWNDFLNCDPAFRTQIRAFNKEGFGEDGDGATRLRRN